MTELARRHDLTAVTLVDEEFDIDECRQAMQAYCREVVLVPNPYGREGLTVEVPDANLAGILRLHPRPPLPDPDAAVREALAHPVSTAPLAELARGRRSACVVHAFGYFALARFTNSFV